MTVKNKTHVKLLEGLIPICAYCKKIRDDTGKVYGEGNWERIDDHMYEEADREFTHGICPECVEIAFPHISKQVRV